MGLLPYRIDPTASALGRVYGGEFDADGAVVEDISSSNEDSRGGLG